eukprot:s3930_g12.t1
MQAACFAKLCQVTDAAQCIVMSKKYAELTLLQQQHLAAFNLAWGSSLTRPKHHHALHLGEQYARNNTTPNCWGTEAKHRDYKQVFSHALQHLLREEEGGAAFSRSLMPRLLLRTIAMLNENPLRLTGFALKREFTLEEVARVTGLQDCKMATECQIDMLSLKERVVRKAQNLARGTDCFKGLSGASSEAALPVANKKSEERSTPAVRKDAVKELLEIEGVGPSSTCEVRFLKDDIALKVFCELVSGLTAGGQVLLRAYSCDQPDVVKALTESSSRSVRISMICDQGQTGGKTKAQLQCLKQLQASGVRVKLCKGKSVQAAYKNDSRNVSDSVVEDWITAWEELWEQSSSIEDFEGASASSKAGRPRAVEQ